MQGGEQERHRYILLNSMLMGIIVPIICLVALAFLGSLESIFLSLFLAFIFALLIIRRKIPFRQIIMPLHELMFDYSGIWYNRSLFVPWHLIADISYYDSTDDVGFKGRKYWTEITISYLNPEQQRVEHLAIAGWTPKFGQMKNRLEDIKNAAMPRHLECPQCKKEFAVDAQEDTITYSCERCGQKYVQKLD